MASSTSETIIPPTPPPPPPLINNDNINTTPFPNGPTTSQTRVAANGTSTTSTDGAKPWQRVWSVDEMRKGASNWSLASDAGMLHYLQEFSQNMLSQTHSMEQKVDGLVHETKGISAKVHNTFNDFLMLSNTQFIENRVYDEEETKDEEEKNGETAAAQEKEKTREELETEVIPKINEAIQSGLAVLDSAFVIVEITPEQISDDEDEGALPENLKSEPILELTDVYAHRKLPSFIGTPEFQKDDLVGLGESSSEDEEEASDKEASMESDEEKSTEDEETSESETVSGSPSESEESSTATESEEEKEVVARKKAKKESVQEESDDELFAASGTVKSSKSKHSDGDEDDDSEETDEDKDRENEQQQRKPAAPLDFSAELAARLGVKPKKPVADSDEEAVNDEDWDESEKHESEGTKDDLFSASVDTNASMSSKSSKRKDKKHKKRKSRSSSHASHESGTTPALVAGNVSSDLERSERHDEDGEDDLFARSIDTNSSVVSKGSRSRHIHKKKTERSDSQLSNASSKSGQKEKKPTSIKEENNLFGDSPEGDLFDEDTSSPFGKKGGMFSGGGGLFDDVIEDEAAKPDNVDSNVRKSSQEQHESDEEIVKPKPRTSSGKKLPAGAVAIFGDHGPFGHMPVQTNEHHVTKSSPVEKKEPAPSGGGLFSDEGEDIFTSSQSSSVVSNKPAVATKAPKSVDLFGTGDDDADDDDDSLFGAKPAKITEPKAEPPKKKIPAGAVSIFGSGSPPALFSSSNSEPPKPVAAPDSRKQSVKSTKEASGLFDEEDDKTSSFNSERSAVSSAAAPFAPAVEQKRKTNQISLFDDNDDDEDDGDDLFASIAPSKTIDSSKNKATSRPEPSTEAKTKAADVTKPAPKRSTISLFDDYDDEEDEEEDIFSIKPSSKTKPPEVKPAGKSSTPSPGLFVSAEEDPLFSGAKSKSVMDVDTGDDKPSVKSAKQKSSALIEDNDAEPKLKEEAVESQPAKKEEKQSEELFDADSDAEEKDEEDGVRNAPGRKLLPGAVPMFGGIDIFAGQKTMKAKPQGDSLFADDEDDLFATAPKPVPTATPRAKPRKPRVALPEKSSSPLKGTNIPEQSSSVASTSSKTNVGQLQKTLAFNPAAMLPGAGPPSKKQESTTEPVAARKPIIFNPATMLPGAVPPPRKQEASVEATFDKPASVKTLESSGRDRIRVRGNRRPPTRQARQKAANESMDDTSLFGSNLAGPPASTERLIGTRGGQTSLFSDSEDLFRSSSYKAPQKYNQTPHATQSRTPKFDPLFIHNATASTLPSFEDSIDGISSDDTVNENQKDIVSNTPSDKSKTEPLLQTALTDDLFNMSTESEISFLPKSNVDVNHVSNEQVTTQKSKYLLYEKSKDDLFSLSTESESSILRKTKTDSVFDKKSNDDLFSESTESDISYKVKPTEVVSVTKNEKSKTDLFSDSTSKDDMFSQSAESNVSVPKEMPSEDISTATNPRSNTDPLFDNKIKGNLTQSVESNPSLRKVTETRNQKSKTDPLFDNKIKGDLFSQSIESNKADSQTIQPTEDKTVKEQPKTDSLVASKANGDLFGQPVESKKTTSQKVPIIEDDDEDDLFKANSRPLFSPPPLDFDSEFSASGDFTTKSNSKPVIDDIFDDDDDIFAPKFSKKKSSDNKTEIETPKIDGKDDKKEESQVKPKENEVKKTNEVDLFADTGSIFDDLPKKSKDKKKKKTGILKEENIFDETKVASEDTSTSKTTKKTKGKKKGKSKILIFDEDSPSIFDDPLNATSK